MPRQRIITIIIAISIVFAVMIPGQVAFAGSSPAMRTERLVVGLQNPLDRAWLTQMANAYQATILDRKSTRLNSSHIPLSRMPSSA